MTAQRTRAKPPPHRGTEHDRPAVLALVGPTAVGKTALALAVADVLPVEVVSADSRTVYRWMDIGTAKPTPDERRRLPHHLIHRVAFR
jgi:tRNA dimethylallyltransferase